MMTFDKFAKGNDHLRQHQSVLIITASHDRQRKKGAMTIQDSIPTEPTETIQGVVFGKSIRSYYAILHVAMMMMMMRARRR